MGSRAEETPRLLKPSALNAGSDGKALLKIYSIEFNLNATTFEHLSIFIVLWSNLI